MIALCNAFTTLASIFNTWYPDSKINENEVVKKLVDLQYVDPKKQAELIKNSETKLSSAALVQLYEQTENKNEFLVTVLKEFSPEKKAGIS